MDTNSQTHRNLANLPGAMQFPSQIEHVTRMSGQLTSLLAQQGIILPSETRTIEAINQVGRKIQGSAWIDCEFEI